MKTCENCIHFEVCAIYLPQLPICDSYKRKEDIVSNGLIEQYKWERDVAIAQLEEIGLSLGQKIEGVYLTKEEYEKLHEYKYMYENLSK